MVQENKHTVYILREEERPSWGFYKVSEIGLTISIEWFFAKYF